MAEPRFALNGWLQNSVSVLTLALLFGGMLVGTTLWVVSGMHQISETNLAAISAQAALTAKSQTIDAGHATDRLSIQIERAITIEGDLSIAIQRLNDLLPPRQDKKR